LDDGQVEISLHFESNEPITYRRYKDIWKYIMGFNANEDYELRLGSRIIADDDMVIDDSGMREPIYDFQIHLYMEEDRKVYYYLPKPKTNADKLKDIHTWFWSYSDDTLTFNNSMKVYNLQSDRLNDTNNNPITKLSAIKINFT
jgi:hypothetical protein